MKTMGKIAKYLISTLIIFGVIQEIESTLCTNIPPGLAKLQRGVDITKLDLIPLNDFYKNDGFRRNVFDYTCDENKTWINPFDTSKIYTIPDQIDSIQTIPGGTLNAESEIYSSFEDSKKSSSKSLNIGFIKGFFSGSGSTMAFEDLILNTTKQVVEVKAAYSTIQADNLPTFLLEPGRVFKAVIARRLPANFSENPAAYEQFIRYFGTHTFDSGKFGGVFKATTEFDTSLKKQMSSETIKAEAQATFFNIVKANGGYDGSTQVVSELFKSKSTTRIHYYGGTANLFGHWDAWSSTIPGNPWLFGGALNPITDLVRADEMKKNSLEKAIEVYLDKAYLQELRNILYSFLNRGTRIGAPKITEMVQRSISMSAQVVPNHVEVETLDQQVRSNILPAEWFSQKTKICYNWYADGDAGQCGGGAPNTICANVGEQTQYYRDDTDYRGGGCQMRLGIMSPGAEAWFTQGVKMCYRWYADGDGGQCGNHEGRNEYCASIGDYTPFYRDDTDKRGGGCQMSWRIFVPADAPLWMLNTRLCYFWYADGDAGQCGGGAGSPLCATANEWTQYYRDDTDKRGGGCQMSWGIFLN